MITITREIIKDVKRQVVLDKLRNDPFWRESAQCVFNSWAIAEAKRKGGDLTFLVEFMEKEKEWQENRKENTALLCRYLSNPRKPVKKSNIVLFNKYIEGMDYRGR